MGSCGLFVRVVAVVVVVQVVVRGSSVPKRGVNEIEAYVKRLEYEVKDGQRRAYVVGSPEETFKVDLNLLPDDVIVKDIEQGLEEEFELVDKATDDKEERKKNETEKANERQRSLIYQGVYFPDSRFNAFADGVMINMVAEIKRKEMDPLYFRVFSRGIIEHVPLSSSTTPSSSSGSPSSSSSSSSSRRGKQDSPIGGGVIRGLSKAKRFGNAEMQIAGNTTLVRTHYVLGPLNLELLFTTKQGVRAVNSTLGGLAAHTVTQVNNASLVDLLIDSPAPYEVTLVGAKSERYRRLSVSALTRLFKAGGRLERRLKGTFRRARRRRIPDVIRRREGRRGGRGRGERGGEKKEESTVTELP